MRTAFLLLIFLSLACASFSQRAVRFTIGPEYSVPLYYKFPSNGIGGSLTLDIYSRNRVSANVEVGYNSFRGPVISEWWHDTIRRFSFMPIVAGLKFSIREKFYATFRAGIINSKHVFSYTISPAAGIVFPDRHNPRFDLGVRLVSLLGGAGIEGSTFLPLGGYSYLNFRAAIVL